jgi:hypothetical protein
MTKTSCMINICPLEFIRGGLAQRYRGTEARERGSGKGDDGKVGKDGGEDIQRRERKDTEKAETKKKEEKGGKEKGEGGRKGIEVGGGWGGEAGGEESPSDEGYCAIEMQEIFNIMMHFTSILVCNLSGNQVDLDNDCGIKSQGTVIMYCTQIPNVSGKCLG